MYPPRKTTFNRWFGLAIASIVLAAAVAGLPKASAAEGAFDWKQANGTSISVSLNQHPYADAIIKRLPAFKELTGIDVRQEMTPEENYFDKVTTQLSSGSGEPDVFMTGAYQMWDYASAKRIEPLDKYMDDPALTNPDYNVKDIFEGVLNAGKWSLKAGAPTGSGNLWSLPLGFELYALAYNKKLFDEKKLTPPATLDELAALAKQLKGWNGPGSYGVAVRGTRNWATIHPGYMTSFTSAGAKDFEVKDGKLTSVLDSPESVAVTKKFAEMIKEGGPPGWSNYTWYQCSADLGAGKAAMLFDADIAAYFQNVAGSSSQSGNIAFAPPPVAKAGDQPVSNEWVWQIAMNASSKNKKAAWLFMQYFTGPEFDLWAALNAKTVNPARQSVWDNEEFKQKLAAVSGYEETFRKTVPNAGIKFTPQPFFIESTTQWAAALQKIVLSGADPDKAMKELAKRISRDTTKLKLE